MKQDIKTLEDIVLIVNTFYGRVQEDESIGPIFNDIIQERWPQHLEIMYKFWQSILLDQNTYTGQPFLKHINLGIEEHHFARWLYHFHSTVDELFTGPIADDAKKRSAQIAGTFNSKLNFIRSEKS